MAAVSGFQQSHVGISHDLGAGFRQQADKRVISGMDYKSWERNIFNHAISACAHVIILSFLKAAVARRNHIIKFADSSGKAINLSISVREQLAFTLVGTHQTHEKLMMW